MSSINLTSFADEIIIAQILEQLSKSPLKLSWDMLKHEHVCQTIAGKEASYVIKYNATCYGVEERTRLVMLIVHVVQLCGFGTTSFYLRSLCGYCQGDTTLTCWDRERGWFNKVHGGKNPSAKLISPEEHRSALIEQLNAAGKAKQCVTVLMLGGLAVSYNPSIAFQRKKSDGRDIALHHVSEYAQGDKSVMNMIEILNSTEVIMMVPGMVVTQGLSGNSLDF